ncbi:MAG: flagellar filament capping protein FliD [Terracidiphilus sp.]|jgi:flagellar hook-associated protein 2
MGTVGLSFGSPTSGTGFDVSTTVASIVSNLENVETPWKTQLSSLESQDTAISSLGTLFSNLSNDLSTLTDLEGIMAEKTGSSSDTDVLTLTAADSTAVAGTHTVEVTSLAQTSSGYLAPIASASDTLSGSITLQVGSGTKQTITLDSSDDTLSGLASAINSSGVGVTASVLTDSSGSRLSLVSGTSGADGAITVSANSIAAAASATLSYSGSAGTSSANSTGTLSPVGSLSDTLTGSISIQVGSNAAQTVSLGTQGETLQELADAINGTSGIGVKASAVTNSDGTSSLSLASQTAGSAGTLTVSSSVSDPSTALDYTAAVTGKDAELTVDGVDLTSASNTVANLIPGVTFQLLAPSATESDGSLEQIQVVIGNDNTGVESAVSQMVSDYNSLISAVNTQEGKDSSGNAEPLFGSPTLSLLQQQLLGGLNTANPNGTLDAISDDTGTVLSGSMTITVGSGTTENVVIGAEPSTGAAADTVYTGSGVNTLAGLASAINSADIGVTATVVTSDGQSTLSLLSQTAGSSGALSVTSAIAATSDTALSSTVTAGSSSTTSSATLSAIADSGDTLAGSISIQVGSGAAQTITLDSTDNTLSGLADAINNTSGIGVKASLNSDRTVLTLQSGTAGTAGTLTVTSNLLDTTDTSTTTLKYTNSSDINSLTGLGISVNNDGSLTFDATSLDSVLNTDYSSVVGFFQNASGWGQSFSNMLTNAGTSSTTGVLALASSSNSDIESTLNADISKEQSYISAQQTSLTAELNSANEIMQQLPTQLEGVNELYSAITGYDENTNG